MLERLGYTELLWQEIANKAGLVLAGVTRFRRFDLRGDDRSALLVQFGQHTIERLLGVLWHFVLRLVGFNRLWKLEFSEFFHRF